MNKFSTPTKKDFLKFVNKFNEFLGNKLALLTIKNFKQVFIDLIYDRRFIITTLITLLSLFAHLSTPAFYQDKWVLGKIKKQLQNEFDIELILPEEVNYSMFPIPSFYLSNVKIAKNGEEIGIIDKMKLCLTFNKFLEKEKINIQDIHIYNSKFEIYGKDLKSLSFFFDKEINSKKLFIYDSNIFLKNKNDEIYSILKLNKSNSYFDEEQIKNKLSFTGNIYNNPIKIDFENNYLTKKSKLNIKLDKINKEIKIQLDYLKENTKILLEILDGSISHITNINLNNDLLRFNSNKKINDEYIYDGFVNLYPFFSIINVNLENINLYDLFNQNYFFIKLLNSSVVKNPNLNYEIKLNSKKVSNHRLFKNLKLKLSFDQNKFTFDNSKILFDEEIEIELSNSELVSNQNKNYIYGDVSIKMPDGKKLFSFFQTNKKFRKKLDNINFTFKYDLNSQIFIIERLNLNNKSNKNIQDILNEYNNEKNSSKKFKKLSIQKFFNKIISTL